MIKGMFDIGALPTLERVMQFTSERHKLITHNIANLSTPDHRPVDASVSDFQKTLGEAVDQRRRKWGTPTGALNVRDSREVRFSAGGLSVRPSETNENILFQDGNNRDLERTMQKLAENTMMHQYTLEMLKNQYDLMQTAIQERP